MGNICKIWKKYDRLFATHSFTNSSSPDEIEKYLDFLDNWYENHQSELHSGELEKFKNKVEGVRKEWPFKVSHLVLLGMRRQSKPDKRYIINQLINFLELWFWNPEIWKFWVLVPVFMKCILSALCWTRC